ncbi:MAG: sigma-70 family RNA polymerase sigma factor [Bacteroidales bacterium]|nr:sigma-70 family RNA polymerase sigma factor [Bacteroidales bacterium]
MEESRKKEEFLSLITEHQDLIRKVAAMYYKNRADQEDAFQEILVNLWKAYPTFRGESKITTWMYRVALNTVISGFRKASNRVQRNRSDVNISDELIKPERDQVSNEDIHVLYQSIERLTDIEKAVIMLYMEEKTYDDIAEIMGMTRTNVGVKINRIKKKLQKLYKELANGY